MPEALFEKAQACMREYREREVMTGGGNLLKRKVICGVCGHAMQRDNKKNGSYRCVMKRLNTGFDCSEEKSRRPIFWKLSSTPYRSTPNTPSV